MYMGLVYSMKYVQYLLLLLGLHKKTVVPGAEGLEEHLKNPSSTDLFGSSDAICFWRCVPIFVWVLIFVVVFCVG